MNLDLINKFRGCIYGGAIGDAMGSAYENCQDTEDEETYYLFGKPPKSEPEWQITDDTQLTLITCESIVEANGVNPAHLAASFTKAYQANKLTGLGASTLKALRELEFGGHWSQVGRRGEYAAGNGAAMRIAPLAFCENISRSLIRDVCSITHHNDEAYVGALAVVIAITETINGSWQGGPGLAKLIIDQIPDTRVRDRLAEIDQSSFNLQEIGQLGNDGYVVNTVPLAIKAVEELDQFGFASMLKALIDIGGDTDTVCSIAGQIGGALIGYDNIPIHLKSQLEHLNNYNWIKNTSDHFVESRLM